jgi:hypothetical protein
MAAIWDRSKVWLFKAQKPEFIGVDKEIENAMDWFQKNILHFKQKMLSPILQCVKTGTGIVKIDWREKRRLVPRYATPEEIKDKNVNKYKLRGTQRRGVKYIETEYVGPDIFPVDRKDFVISADATSMQDAYIVGHKFPLRKPELEARTLQKNTEGNSLYDPEAVKKLVTPPAIDDGKERRAEMQGKTIDYVDKVQPYWIWEIWVKFDVDEDGEEDDIVITMEPESGEILRCIYNPLFKGFRPFVDFVFYPHEYCFDGEGVVEILEKIQIEVDSLHNLRNDRLASINAPETLIRAGAGLDDFQRSPGKVHMIHGEIDDTVIRELQYSDRTFSTYQEEDRLIAFADRAAGTPPVAMGFAESERPVAKETFARQHEMQRRFNYGIQNIMYKVVELGYMFLEFFAQYQPEYAYRTEVGGAYEEQTINFPLDMIRDGFKIEIEGATRLTSQEERREASMAKYQLLSDYYTKIAGMINALGMPQTPVPLKQFIMRVLEPSDKIMADILKDFNCVDAEEYIVNAKEFIDPAMVMRQPLPMPPQGEGQQQPSMGGVRY